MMLQTKYQRQRYWKYIDKRIMQQCAVSNATNTAQNNSYEEMQLDFKFQIMLL